MSNPATPWYPITHDDGAAIANSLNATNLILSAIAANGAGGGLKITSPADVQELVRRKLHYAIQVRDQLVFERETALTASKGDSTGITGVTVVEETFLAAVGEAHEGIYEATFDGAAWHKENGDPIILADYGITVEGSAVEGDHIIITETAASLAFDVLDHDKLVETGVNSLVLGMHKVMTYGTIPFDAPQLMYYTADGLPAGKYRFTLDHGAYGGGTGQDGTYMFETTQAIPAGGGWRHTTAGVYQGGGYTKAQITGGKVNTYGAQPARSVVESNLAVAEWDGTTECTDLGKFSARSADYSTDITAHNFTERNAYGSNRYAHSAARQWLNSAGKAVTSGDTAVSHWWTPQTVFDMVPGGATMAGFLHGLDPALVAVLGTAKVVVSIPDSDRTSGGPTSETLYDKVFLFSMTEVGFGSNNGVAEGEKLAYYDGATNADRVKREGSTARYWWLRGPYPGYAHRVRFVDSSGALDVNLAFNAIGLVPGLIISSN